MKTHKRFFRRSAVLAAAAAVGVMTVTAMPASAGTSGRVELPSPNPGDLGGTPHPLDAGRQVALRVYLADRPELAAAARAVSDPADARYGHFLTPAQVNHEFGPTTAQVSAVSAWVRAQGMTVTATNQHYLAVSATVAQADAAFATQISEFDTVISGPKGSTTIREAGVVGGFSVPAAVAADIVSVTGIDQLALGTTSTSAAAPRATTAKATDFPCSQYWSQHTRPIPPAFGHTTAPTQLCGYTPDQVRHAYGLTSSPYTGKGATIAVLLSGHTPTLEADSNRFFAAHGEPVFAPGQYTENIGPDADSTCEAKGGAPTEEEAIDVQSAHLAAPDAHIVYLGIDCADFDVDLLPSWLDGVTRIVDEHLADVASGSFGLPELGFSPASIAPWDPILQQGALEGIGFDFSSGDGGGGGVDDDPLFPASDPWSTAVGGTSLAIGADGSVVADYPWGDRLTSINAAGTGYDAPPPGTFRDGSGGGVSRKFPEPAYQKHVVPDSLATHGRTAVAGRVIPDISAGAGNGWLIGATGLSDPDAGYEELPEGGGTSASAPLVAGLEADAMQAAGHPLGFANAVLYRLSGGNALRDILPVDPADPPIALGAQDFTEIDPGGLTTFGEDDALTATPGYDDVTGLGAPTPAFVGALGRRF
ncbi:S53 family serine peptidase [Amycolatopsis sp. NPDC051373]|uniref:S53 family peptidase n=1 Tax=Amycolatopsis sp. NPDC051373 TaxID=3155801 RepID=UPI00344F29F7